MAPPTNSQSRSNDREEWDSFLKFMKTQLPREDKYDHLFEEISSQYSRVEPILIQRGYNKDFIALVNKGVEKLKAGSNNPNKVLYKVREALNEAEKSERENLTNSSSVDRKVVEAEQNGVSRDLLKQHVPESDSNGTETCESKTDCGSRKGNAAPGAGEKPSSCLNQSISAKTSNQSKDLEMKVDEKTLNPASPCKRKLPDCSTNDQVENPQSKIPKTDDSAENPVNVEIEVSVPHVSNGNPPGPSSSGCSSSSRSQTEAPGTSRTPNSDQALAIGGDEDYSQYSIDLRNKIVKLENLLQRVHKEIHKMESKEMTIEDMENESIYQLIDKYKKKGLQIYLKVQELKNRPSTLQRKQYKTILYKGSQYSELNSMITSLINKDIDAPDFVEVLDTVKKFNSRHFKFMNVETAAQKIFREVVKLFKKRRCCDLRDVFSNKQIDLSLLKNDPAIGNKDLQNKLKENKLLCKDEKEILQQFTEASEVALKLCNVDADKVSKSLIQQKFPNATSIFVKDNACFLGFDKKADLDDCLISFTKTPIEIDGQKVELERVVLSEAAGLEEGNEDVSNEEENEEFEENGENDVAEMDVENDSDNHAMSGTTAKVEPNEFLSDTEEPAEGSGVELDIFGFPLRQESSCTRENNVESISKDSTPSENGCETKQKSICSKNETSSEQLQSKCETSASISSETSSSITAATDKIEKRDASSLVDTHSQSKSTMSKLNDAKLSDPGIDSSSSSGNACIIVDDDDDEDDIICLDD